jgi:hypothetical protein
MGLDEDAGSAVIRRSRDSFEHEFGITTDGRDAILARLRPLRRRLLGLLDGHDQDDPVLAAARPILEERSALLRAKAGELRSALGESPPERYHAIAASMVHMFLNRLLRGAHRRQELVLSVFLDRLYDSRQAQARNG